MAPDMQAKDLAFSCPTTHGIVPPGEKKCVSVFFCPETLNIRTTDYLSIVPSGCASQTLLKLVGFCRGTGNCRTLHRPWGQEQPTPRPGKYSPPVPKGQTPHCPSAWVSAAPWWLIGGIIADTWRKCSRLGTWRSAQAAGAPGLSDPAFCLQTAAPPISGNLSETPSGKWIPRPQPGGRAYSQEPHQLCPGPGVSLQHYCVNFSWVNLGEHSEKSLWIENKSDCTAHFQFAIDCQESVFSIRPTFGTLVGKARMTLHCAFQPTHPIIYFRRVACLIHHQVSGCGVGQLWGGPGGQSEAQ